MCLDRNLRSSYTLYATRVQGKSRSGSRSGGNEGSHDSMSSRFRVNNGRKERMQTKPVVQCSSMRVGLSIYTRQSLSRADFFGAKVTSEGIFKTLVPNLHFELFHRLLPCVSLPVSSPLVSRPINLLLYWCDRFAMALYTATIAGDAPKLVPRMPFRKGGAGA